MEYQLSLVVQNVVLWCIICGVRPANIPVPDHKITPVVVTTQSNTPSKRNCSDLNTQFLSWNDEDREGIFIYEQSHVANCTGKEVIVKENEPSAVEQWKTNVIISCTVTAAVEIFIIIILILYWKQIRWSLRKLKCPCEESQRNSSSQPESSRRTVSRPRHRQSRSSQRNRPENEESELTPMNPDPEINQSENRLESSATYRSDNEDSGLTPINPEPEVNQSENTSESSATNRSVNKDSELTPANSNQDIHLSGNLPETFDETSPQNKDTELALMSPGPEITRL